MTKFEEEFNYLIELSGKVLIGQVDAEAFEKNRVSFFEKYETDQQQALPVVPECVGEFVSGDETKLSKADRIAYLLKSVEGDNYYLEEYLTNAGIISQEQGEHLYAWATNQTHETILELRNGYTVEKPQQKRYEVKLLSGESMHFNPIGNPKNIKDYRFAFGNYAGWKTQFTKSELVEIKDGMFLKRIPGGTPLDDLGKDKSYYVWIEDCNYWKNPFIELVPVEDGE